MHVDILLGKNIPSREAILLQIWVCMKAMPMYVSLPTLSEYMIENGWTRCYSSIREVGVGRYILLTFVYLVLVEFGIYWMHRTLHDCKPLYKWLHATHHIYNKENTLSPFAGMKILTLSILGWEDPHSRVCLNPVFINIAFLSNGKTWRWLDYLSGIASRGKNPKILPNLVEYSQDSPYVFIKFWKT